MTEKRFRLTNSKNKFRDMNCGINDINKILTFTEVVKLLNKLYEDNKELKKINQEYKALFQDIGMILSHNEIINKITQPLDKPCGFDVDVDTANGFTIITNKKELNEWINENELKK